MRLLATLVGILALAHMVQASAEAPGAGEIRSAVEGNVAESLALYREFLALPNDANYPADIENLLSWMEDAFAGRGFKTRRLAMPGSDALFAEKGSASADKTVLVYLQADGQPVDPAAWDQENPFLAVLKQRGDDGSWQRVPWELAGATPDPDWRVFARSALVLRLASAGPRRPITITRICATTAASASMAQTNAMSGACCRISATLIAAMTRKTLFCTQTVYFDCTCDSNQYTAISLALSSIIEPRMAMMLRARVSSGRR